MQNILFYFTEITMKLNYLYFQRLLLKINSDLFGGKYHLSTHSISVSPTSLPVHTDATFVD